MAVEHTYNGVNGDITINFTTEIISCENTIETLEIQELVDACREAEYSEKGIAFTKICNASGKDYLDIDNGVQVGITIVLLGNWVVYTERNSGVFKVTGGNLVQVSGGDPFEPNPLVTYVNIQSAAGTVVSISSGSGLSTAEHNQLMAIPLSTLSTEESQRLETIETEQQKQLTEDRFVNLNFRRTNTITGTGVDKKISGYTAGDPNDDPVDVAVTYDEAGQLGLPESESIT